jgi:hypothetical protein
MSTNRLFEMPEGVREFIECPGQNFGEGQMFTEAELALGVKKIVSVLENNPLQILAIIHTIITQDTYSESTFLFEDLADKLRTQDQLDKLGLLAGTKSLPKFENAIIAALVSNTNTKLMQKILCAEKEAGNSPQDVLAELIKAYPNQEKLANFVIEPVRPASRAL